MLKQVTVSIFAFLISTTGWAKFCPDLAGRYTCEGRDGNRLLAIEQSYRSDGLSVFKISNWYEGSSKDITFKVVTDSQPYKFDSGEEAKGTISSSCILVMNIRNHFPGNWEPYPTGSEALNIKFDLLNRYSMSNTYLIKKSTLYLSSVWKSPRNEVIRFREFHCKPVVD